MKNLFLVLLLIAGLKTYSQEIDVTYPLYEDVFLGGQTITVTWTTVGVIPKVKIELHVMDMANQKITLVDSVANTGSCQVVLPVFASDVRPSIFVYSLYGQVIADGSNPFYIVTTLAFHVEAGLDRTICRGQPTWLSILPGAHGGTPPYTYTWSNGMNPDIPQVAPVVPTMYYMTATDSTGAIAVDSVFVDMDTTYQPIRATITWLHGYTPDTVTVSATGGLPPYTVRWSYDGSTGNTITVDSTPYDGYSLYAEVTDATGCSALSDSVNLNSTGPVWPGDADINGAADNNDLLPIGLAYGANGIARWQGGIGWYGHIAQPWVQTLPPGINYMHIDCNGDGTINANDTSAIMLNFGQIHPKTDDEPEWRANNPVLNVQLNQDTVHAGDTLYADIFLGDSTVSADNVYGLAFTLNYDVNIVDTSATGIVFADSWLGTASDKISIAKDLKLAGELKCAITRIDHTNRSGAGQIGQATFIITTDNINGKDLAYYGAHIWISDVLMINGQGNQLDVNAGRDSVQVEFEPLGIADVELRNADLKIQPNPANEMVLLSVTKELIGGNLKVLDLEGRTLINKTVSASTFKLETAELTAGIYLIQVYTAYGTLTRRLVVAK